MEQRAHDCAAVGGGVIHQRVEVGQQHVADVQHIPGDILKRGVPRHGVLPLKRENSVISFGRKEKNVKDLLIFSHFRCCCCFHSFESGLIQWWLWSDLPQNAGKKRNSSLCMTQKLI